MNDIKNIFYENLCIQEEYGGICKPVNSISPLVSVVVVTYQHAKYIRDCLDGILMQKTDFEYEIIIGEDGSTDGTREICIEYANNHPDKIRLFLRDRTTSHVMAQDGSKFMFNGHLSRAEARGKYIAICEGDDYWVFDKKLQIQAESLQNDPTMSICYTDVMTSEQKEVYKRKYVRSTTKELIEGNHIATCTVMYRNIIKFSDLPEKLLGLWFFDYSLWLMLSLHGDISMIDVVTSVYRIHNTGLTRSTGNLKKYLDWTKFFGYWKMEFHDNKRYLQIIRSREIINQCNLAMEYRKYGDIAKSIKALYSSINLGLRSNTIFMQTKASIYFFAYPIVKSIKRICALTD